MAIPTFEEVIANYKDKHEVRTNPATQPAPQQDQSADLRQAISEYAMQQATSQNYLPAGTQPVENYNPYTTEIPQNVQNAQQELSQVNIASQEYADQMTAKIISHAGVGNL